jgi:hypothetical protein
MPCCAFAAMIVAQLLLGVRAVKRRIFGGVEEGLETRNPAVEWRLGDAGEVTPPPRARSAAARWSFGGFAAAAVFEVLIAAGAIYGLAAHLGHHGGHAADAHHVRGAVAASTSEGQVRGAHD